MSSWFRNYECNAVVWPRRGIGNGFTNTWRNLRYQHRRPRRKNEYKNKAHISFCLSVIYLAPIYLIFRPAIADSYECKEQIRSRTKLHNVSLPISSCVNHGKQKKEKFSFVIKTNKQREARPFPSESGSWARAERTIGVMAPYPPSSAHANLASLMRPEFQSNSRRESLDEQKGITWRWRPFLDGNYHSYSPVALWKTYSLPFTVRTPSLSVHFLLAWLDMSLYV